MMEPAWVKRDILMVQTHTDTDWIGVPGKTDCAQNNKETKARSRKLRRGSRKHVLEDEE